jgi:hypothetical protein
VQRQIQQLAVDPDVENWFRNVAPAAARGAAQLCIQVPRSAGDDGQVMELLLFENRECSIPRKACGESAPWLRCQYCSSAAGRNSPASSPRSVFGDTRHGSSCPEQHIQLGVPRAGYGVDAGECFSERPPDLAAGRPRLAPRTILLMVVDPCTGDEMQASMSLPARSQ